MNSIKLSLKNNKKYFKLLLLLLSLGFLIGFILIKKVNLESIFENIKNIETYLNTNKISFLSNHIITILILFLCSITVIGLIVFPIYFIYEGICIFFNIYTLISVFKFNGFIYSVIYNIVIKGIYLILLILIFRKLIILLKNILLKSDKNGKKVVAVKFFKQIGICIVLLILNDLLVYLLGNKILSIFLFIIK